MKRAEFITGFVAERERSYRANVKLGTMRQSEAAMGMADSEKDAAKLWRKHRADYSRMSFETLFPRGGK